MKKLGKPNKVEKEVTKIEDLETGIQNSQESETTNVVEKEVTKFVRNLEESLKNSQEPETPNVVEKEVTKIEDLETGIQNSQESETPIPYIVEKEVTESENEEMPESEKPETKILTNRELLIKIFYMVKELSAEKITLENKPKRRTSMAQKKERKEVLKANGPYSKEQLEKMSRPDLTMYASTLSLGKDKTFGKATQELIKNILVGQKSLTSSPKK